ncbi:hypothetical protein MUK42_15336 [Musa troglodytarum]|uniref:Protein EXECUTER 2, chloroplastic n=1 Tax=Musa troglodytarum TaxID=320322 RepID=A0A9E7IJY7_9LILI|nr:hypothetical protein MUK42_15336 [Musa troglodytarum]
MSMTNSWAAAAPPPPGPLLRPPKLEPSSRELHFLSLAASSPRRPALRRNRGPPALFCQRGDFASNNTTSGGGGGICSDWDWNRWNQHFSETDQAESFSSLLKPRRVVAPERCPEEKPWALFCQRGDFASNNTTSGGGCSLSAPIGIGTVGTNISPRPTRPRAFPLFSRETLEFKMGNPEPNPYFEKTKFQLEEAVEREDFLEAAKLKAAIAEATSKDTVAEVMSELKYAIEEERYHDASRLCMLAGSGLVGWWAGGAKDSGDPFGRIVRITPAVGRYIAKSYSPRQLLSGSSGTPLFEIFLVKDDDGKFLTQVVALQPVKETSTLSTSSPSRGIDDTPKSPSLKSSIKVSPTTDEIGSDSSKDSEEENKEDAAKIRNVDNVISKDSDEEGLKSIINFFKERIPGFNVSLANNSVQEEIKMDAGSSEQLVQEDDEKDGSPEYSINDESKSENSQGEMLPDGEDADSANKSKNMAVKLFVGGVLHNKDDSMTKSYKRIPAEMIDVDKGSFTLYLPGRSTDPHIVERKPEKIRVAAVANQSASDLMPSDVANAFFSSDKAISKVSEEVREVIRLAISHAQRRNKLKLLFLIESLLTIKAWILLMACMWVLLVPMVLRWYRYSANMVIGMVTFRAKIGKGSRRSNRGMYPEELGVVASYKGQGRIAEPGFKNPQWVDGELLQFNGKGLGPYFRGTELGFLYVVPEQKFLVLFERLKLPN